MTQPTLDRARAGDEQAFHDLTGPYLGELQRHCYRILGSVQDAEDVLQETLLAAWQGLAHYEERASMRTWLYRIATSRCLNALRASARRPRRDPGGPPFTPPEPTRRGEPDWLEPYPDVLLELADPAPGPDTRYESRETMALAFVAALQHLPPRQRAVLLLRDVLGFHAAEVAGMLDSSEAAVNSALQRSRATLAAQLPGPGRDGTPIPSSARERELAGRFAAAYAADDIDAVVALLTEDAWYTVLFGAEERRPVPELAPERGASPPVPLEYQGRAAIAGFLRYSADYRGGRRQRLIPTRANGQPAFACYYQDEAARVFRAHGLIVLTLDGDQICAITRFMDNSVLRPFGLPRTL
jgi:RNA polymerase sigma-70 factor (TIGR02960 family)